jgi:hypothetical protein
MGTVAAGDTVFAADNNDLETRLATAEADLAGIVLGAVKSSNQTVNGSDVLTNVTGMSFSVVANAVYAGELVLYYNSGATPDIKFGLTVPSGATGTWGGLGYDFTPVLLAFGPIDITTALGFGGLAADRAAFIRVALTISSTPGTVQLQFAQSTSNASNTTLLAGSWMKFDRIS